MNNVGPPYDSQQYAIAPISRPFCLTVDEDMIALKQFMLQLLATVRKMAADMIQSPFDNTYVLSREEEEEEDNSDDDEHISGHHSSDIGHRADNEHCADEEESDGSNKNNKTALASSPFHYVDTLHYVGGYDTSSDEYDVEYKPASRANKKIAIFQRRKNQVRLCRSSRSISHLESRPRRRSKYVRQRAADEVQDKVQDESSKQEERVQQYTNNDRKQAVVDVDIVESAGADVVDTHDNADADADAECDKRDEGNDADADADAECDEGVDDCL
jgi:hypothetical protein